MKPVAMKPVHSTTVLAFAAALVGLCLLDVASGASAADPLIERGRQRFVATGCYQCHGYMAQGGAAGPKIAPPALPAPALMAFLRSTNRAMPTYPASVLSDADVVEIAAFLSSLPAPRRAADIPLLRAVQ